MTVTLWYNPKCGTCRKVRDAVEAKEKDVVLVEYLKTPPSVQELDAVCRKAGIEPQELARQKEPIYAAIAAKTQGRAAWLQALHDHPILIERPVVIRGNRALIARPPERVRELL